ncbi:hypothetical protein CG51_03270 [Haematobacter missouriensis]|uniref:VPLPA-CTERM sorting domain-containing protein n=1 Tax=Haematobacter missouriensis TaxID=366616 RepID=A0A212AWQ2_9RHOB|nr:VPLPA-CTERM sorting domain-containing protein [Haematobacter missouriensis]KFI33906.1 hypothetical protein CG51_03270 [Haematobacter missouriensis]OWJ71322.1 VPLPA-CTERM sorting domain-containing protein [Haematobacter missouriensis]OWJ85901.1 VPLPA-CTERM sorting domain-containing protein [Haematobacter missouriensis]
MTPASIFATTATLVLLSPLAVNAAVIRVTEDNFTAAAGKLTFSEFAVGTENPVYAPADYGGGAGSPTVYTGGYFTGQSISPNPGTDCPGASPTGCVIGSPTGPLSLDASAPPAFITTDGAFPTSPTLSGTPRFNGPVALLFSEDQTGVGFEAGYFDAVGSTGITAFARDGSILGTVVNTTIGIEFLGLVTDDLKPAIAGVFLDLVGNEPAGYNIDNVRFGVGDEIIPPPISPVPLPAALPLSLAGLGAIALFRRRKDA